jgi:hypothetical protein
VHTIGTNYIWLNLIFAMATQAQQAAHQKELARKLEEYIEK